MFEPLQTPREESTALTRVDASDKITSLCLGGEQSIKFLQDVGKMIARPLGLKNDNEGATVLLIAMCDGLSPVQVVREYHFMDNGPTMKAGVMLAKFNAAGGKHRWIKDGRDGEAVLRLEIDGESLESRYTMDDAKTAQLIKKGGSWEKNPANMLRARATSEGIHMLRPGIVAGIYCPEDFPERGEDQPAAATVPAATTATTTTAAPRRGRPPKSAESPKQDQGEVIDAEVTPAKATPLPGQQSLPLATENAEREPGTEPAATPDTSAASQETAVLMEIESSCVELGRPVAELVASIRAKLPAVNSLDDLSADQAQRVLDNLRAAIAKKNAAATGQKVPF